MSSSFNSIKVRLERSMTEPVMLAHEVFQFHKGAIRTERNKHTTRSVGSFNSIKVRLEQTERQIRAFDAAFQFHKGAIRTAILSPIWEQDRVFQFHKGAIRTTKNII